MSSGSGSNLLLTAAKEAAHDTVQVWIRNVFRETSLQVLRQHWTVVNDEEVEITNTMLEHCRNTCIQLAMEWQQELRDCNLHQVAEWIQGVVDEGNFWSVTVVRAGREEAEVVIAQADSPPQANVNNMDDGEPYLMETRLRNMLESQSTLDEKLATLHQWGKADETMWPHDWSTVEQFLTQIPDRLYQNTAHLEVVPKDMLAEDEQNDQEERVMDFWDRKRKAASRQHNKKKRIEKARDEEGRPPSEHPGEIRWDWQSCKDSLSDKEQLERIYVKDNPSTPNTMSGSLVDLGHFQHLINKPSSVTTEKKQDDKQTDKMKRKVRKVSFKERLGPDMELVIKDDRRRKSKVIRTMSSNEYFFDLDVNNCMLQLHNGDLCAFKSLEVRLKDEND